MRRWRAAAIIATALAGSQLGHLLVYFVEYGPRSWAVQSSGAHAYLPGLLDVVSLVAALSLVVALTVIAAARLLWARGGGSPVARRIPYIELVAGLFILQLAIFCTQETLEALHDGTLPPPMLTLGLEGLVGQLPVAALLAVALTWLLVEFESAVHRLASLAVERDLTIRAAAVVSRLPLAVPAGTIGQVDAGRHGSRAPPSRAREST